jgi:hypothetical protein
LRTELTDMKHGNVYNKEGSCKTIKVMQFCPQESLGGVILYPVVMTTAFETITI